MENFTLSDLHEILNENASFDQGVKPLLKFIGDIQKTLTSFTAKGRNRITETQGWKARHNKTFDEFKNEFDNIGPVWDKVFAIINELRYKVDNVRQARGKGNMDRIQTSYEKYNETYVKCMNLLNDPIFGNEYDLVKQNLKHFNDIYKIEKQSLSLMTAYGAYQFLLTSPDRISSSIDYFAISEKNRPKTIEEQIRGTFSIKQALMRITPEFLSSTAFSSNSNGKVHFKQHIYNTPYRGQSTVSVRDTAFLSAIGNLTHATTSSSIMYSVLYDIFMTKKSFEDINKDYGMKLTEEQLKGYRSYDIMKDPFIKNSKGRQYSIDDVKRVISSRVDNFLKGDIEEFLKSQIDTVTTETVNNFAKEFTDSLIYGFDTVTQLASSNASIGLDIDKERAQSLLGHNLGDPMVLRFWNFLVLKGDEKAQSILKPFMVASADEKAPNIADVKQQVENVIDTSISSYVEEFLNSENIPYTPEDLKNTTSQVINALRKAVAKMKHSKSASRSPKEVIKALEEYIVNDDNRLFFKHLRDMVKSDPSHPIKVAMDVYSSAITSMVSRNQNTGEQTVGVQYQIDRYVEKVSKELFKTNIDDIDRLKKLESILIEAFDYVYYQNRSKYFENPKDQSKIINKQLVDFIKMGKQVDFGFLQSVKELKDLIPLDEKPSEHQLIKDIVDFILKPSVPQVLQMVMSSDDQEVILMPSFELSKGNIDTIKKYFKNSQLEKDLYLNVNTSLTLHDFYYKSKELIKTNAPLGSSKLDVAVLTPEPLPEVPDLFTLVGESEHSEKFEKICKILLRVYRKYAEGEYFKVDEGVKNIILKYSDSSNLTNDDLNFVLEWILSFVKVEAETELETSTPEKETSGETTMRYNRNPKTGEVVTSDNVNYPHEMLVNVERLSGMFKDFNYDNYATNIETALTAKNSGDVATFEDIKSVLSGTPPPKDFNLYWSARQAKISDKQLTDVAMRFKNGLKLDDEMQKFFDMNLSFNPDEDTLLFNFNLDKVLNAPKTTNESTDLLSEETSTLDMSETPSPTQAKKKFQTSDKGLIRRKLDSEIDVYSLISDYIENILKNWLSDIQKV